LHPSPGVLLHATLPSETDTRLAQIAWANWVSVEGSAGAGAMTHVELVLSGQQLTEPGHEVGDVRIQPEIQMGDIKNITPKSHITERE